MKILVLRNRRASEDPDLDAAIGRLHTREAHFDVPDLSYAGQVREIAASVDAAHVDLIIAAGGDGTLNEVVNGLHDAGRLEEIPVGLLPYGTGNDFALGCGIALQDAEAMLRHVIDADEQRVDIGRAGERLFMNAVSGGVGAEATAETPDWLKAGLGKMAYFITGAVKAGNLEGYEAQFEAEDFSWSGKILGFVVANGSHAGGNVCVSPDAKLDDGLLDLTIFPERPASDLTAIAAQFMLPVAERNIEHVVTTQASSVRLDTSSDLHINLDGEPRKTQSVTFEVIPAGLRFRGGCS